MKEETMSVAQIAEMFKVSPSTVRRWIEKGKLKPINENNPLLERPKAWKFKKSDVEALLNPPNS